MNRVLPFLVCACLHLAAAHRGLAAPANANPNVHFRFHFATPKSAGNPAEAPTAQAIAKLPVTRELLGNGFDRLALLPLQLEQRHDPTKTNQSAAFIRPLLPDLLQIESELAYVKENQDWAWITTAKVTSEQAGTWNQNLRALAKELGWGDPKPSRGDNLEGWVIEGESVRTPALFWQGRDWVLFGLGPAAKKALADRARALKESGRPFPQADRAWLEFELSPEFLKAWMPSLASRDLPRVTLSWTGQGEYIQTSGQFDFPSAMKWNIEPWQIPTNIIFDPLVSFTVARGISPLLANSAWFKHLDIQEVPNQFCLWGQPEFYGKTLATIPMKDATNALTKMAPKLPQALQTAIKEIPGNIYWLSNKSELVWRGLPLLSPFIKPTVVDNISYLITGVIPYLGQTNIPPPELYQQIGQRENLLYYSWELTEKRLLHNRHYFQFASIMAQRVTMATNHFTFRWLQEIHTKLGNTITEIQLANPRRLTLTRRSHFGLTGLELVLLTRWIEDIGFPLAFRWPPVNKEPPEHIKKLRDESAKPQDPP